MTENMSVSLVLLNLLVFLRNRPKWVSACKKFNIFISSGFVFSPVTYKQSHIVLFLPQFYSLSFKPINLDQFL